MTVVHITPGPSWVVATAEDDRPTRWCFGCRKRLPHTWKLLTDPPERQPSYYDPICVIECSRCGDDRTVHPGSYRDGPAYPGETVWARLMENANWPPIDWERFRAEVNAFNETEGPDGR